WLVGGDGLRQAETVAAAGAAGVAGLDEEALRGQILLLHAGEEQLLPRPERDAVAEARLRGEARAVDAAHVRAHRVRAGVPRHVFGRREAVGEEVEVVLVVHGRGEPAEQAA